MKTLVDLDRELLEKAKALAGTRTKKETIQTALTELIRVMERQEFRSMLGHYPGFKLSQKDFHRIRHGR